MDDADLHLRMAAPDALGEMLRRIERRLFQLNLSERRAALNAGLSPSQIRTMRRQYLEGKQKGASIRTIAQLAHALQTTPDWLMSGTGRENAITTEPPSCRKSIAGLPLAGAVRAGVWIETALKGDDPRFVLVPADPRYPKPFQSAYEVQGTSTDRFARPGDFLIVVDRMRANLSVRSDDIVIVKRTKGELEEITARRFHRTAPNCELQFESTDARYAGPPLLIRDIEHTNVSLGDIVVAVYRPLV